LAEHVPALLTDLGFAGSRSEARRIIAQGGVRINGEHHAAQDYPGEISTLQVGKREPLQLNSREVERIRLSNDYVRLANRLAREVAEADRLLVAMSEGKHHPLSLQVGDKLRGAHHHIATVCLQTLGFYERGGRLVGPEPDDEG
jgi:hypothetical protein